MALTKDGYRATIDERIAREALRATTGWRMVHHLAFGVGATRTRTRIDTLLVDAGLGRRTIRADDAFGSAIGSRSDHVRQASALSLSGNDRAERVGSARVRIARIGR